MTLTIKVSRHHRVKVTTHADGSVTITIEPMT
jgi:hypothetical protein